MEFTDYRIQVKSLPVLLCQHTHLKLRNSKLFIVILKSISEILKSQFSILKSKLGSIRNFSDSIEIAIKTVGRGRPRFVIHPSYDKSNVHIGSQYVIMRLSKRLCSINLDYNDFVDLLRLFKNLKGLQSFFTVTDSRFRFKVFTQHQNFIDVSHFS